MYDDFNDINDAGYDGPHSIWLPAFPRDSVKSYREKLDSLSVLFREHYFSACKGHLFVFEASKDESVQLAIMFRDIARPFRCYDVGLDYAIAFSIISGMLQSINEEKKNW